MKEKVLVTGATGLLGSTLVDVLKADGFEGDITDEKVFKKYENSGCDWIIHTAAVTDVNWCEENQEHCVAVNVDGTKNVTTLAKKLNARLIYISTASVFSGKEGNYKEDDIPEPTNVYNMTKKDGEDIVLEYEQGIVLRLNLIGIHPDGSRGKNFMEWIFDSVTTNKDLTLFNDVYINPLSNLTIAGMIKRIIETRIDTRVLHIGSEDRLSKAAVARLFIEHFPAYKGSLKEVSVDTLDGPERPKEMWLNVDRAREYFGKLPLLREEIEKIYKVFK